MNDPAWQNPYLDNLFSLQIECVDIVMLLVSGAEYGKFLQNDNNIRNQTITYQTVFYHKSFLVLTVFRGELPSIQQSHVAIAQLRHPVNLGRTLEETHIVVLVLAPSKAVSTRAEVLC